MSKVIVWYDSACPLCQREIALMRRLDRAGRIDFIDATDPATACPIDRTEILARFHAEEKGVMLSGAAAFAAMWRAIPVLWPFGILAKLPGMVPILDWVYGHFLRVRPQLQRLF
jgi:predicted DCC family thiol-disulfide oxidoreductase YuxK